MMHTFFQRINFGHFLNLSLKIFAIVSLSSFVNISSLFAECKSPIVVIEVVDGRKVLERRCGETRYAVEAQIRELERNGVPIIPKSGEPMIFRGGNNPNRVNTGPATTDGIRF